MGVELVHIKQTHLLFGKFQPHVVMKKKVLKALQKRENLLPSGGSYLFSFKGYNNKSNGVRTTDAFSLVLVLIIVLLLAVLYYYYLKVAQVVILSCFRPLSISILVKNGTFS